MTPLDVQKTPLFRKRQLPIKSYQTSTLIAQSCTIISLGNTVIYYRFNYPTMKYFSKNYNYLSHFSVHHHPYEYVSNNFNGYA